ncbi:MAG: siroheme synthase CysG [Sulfitobacter sp.]|nr:siroheme synthase CysG [Sulfitobacter sp.]
MDHFPIFLATEGRRIVLAGGGDAALAKLRLLLKTRAHLTVLAADPAPEIVDWAVQGRLTLHRRAMEPGDSLCAALFYAANEDATEDARTAAIARREGALVNIVDNLADSAFITPAIVDRDPVTVAIGTEGAAPVLARAIKADLEERLPTTLGILARIGKTFREASYSLPFGRPRRDFWRDYYFSAGPKAMDEGQEHVQPALEALLETHLSKAKRPGHVAFVSAGPGDPELLTLKARRALDEADVVLYDRLVTPQILELARREALMIDVGKEAFGPTVPQDRINELLVEHAATGAQVVRLKSGDATLFGRLDEEIEALDAAGHGWHIVPGVTSAAAAVAAMGQSQTRRGRNASVRYLTAHDMKGFADHDWTALAQPGAVSAVYMGKKAARFVQGRMLMHGADRATPVTLVENASRPDQRIIGTRLDRFAEDLTDADMAGPALILLGLAPRAAQSALQDTPLKELA